LLAEFFDVAEQRRKVPGHIGDEERFSAFGGFVFGEKRVFKSLVFGRIFAGDENRAAGQTMAECIFR
jgi:hypothetical protein